MQQLSKKQAGSGGSGTIDIFARIAAQKLSEHPRQAILYREHRGCGRQRLVPARIPGW
jgi:hypothetical protein